MIGLVLSTLLAVSAVHAEELDCRRPEKGHPQPAGADFSQWKWHSTLAAFKRAQCFVKEHPLLASRTCEGGYDVAACAIRDSQLQFESHRAQYQQDYVRAAAQARRAALLGWKSEAVKVALGRLERLQASMQGEEDRLERDKAQAQADLLVLDDGGDAPAPLEARALPVASTVGLPAAPATLSPADLAAETQPATSGGPVAPASPAPAAAPASASQAAPASGSMTSRILGVRGSVIDAEQRSGVSLPLAVEKELVAIGMRESSGRTDAVGDGGAAIGVFQMHRAATIDAGCTQAQWRSGDTVCAVRYASLIDKRLAAAYGAYWYAQHPEWLGLNWNLGQAGFAKYMRQAQANLTMGAQYYLGKWGLGSWEKLVASVYGMFNA